MLSCNLRLVSLDDPPEDDSTSEVVLSEDVIQDSLLESLSVHGLVREIKLVKLSPRTASFSVRMTRDSEAYKAAERLHGSSLQLPNSFMAVVKATYLGPRWATVRVTLSTPSSTNFAVRVRRRFASCGTITRVDTESPTSVIVVFDDVFAALRAVEDYHERGGLEMNPTVDFVDEEKEADKKRHRVPSEREVDASALEEGPDSSTSASKRSRDVSTVDINSSVTPSSPQLVSKTSAQKSKDTKRSRDDAARPVDDEDAESKGGRVSTPGLLNDTGSIASESTASRSAAATMGRSSSDPASFLAAANEGRQLFVVHAKNTEVDDVTALFEDKLGCETVEVKRTKRAGLRGMAFVTFSSQEHAKKVLEELHGTAFPKGSDTKLKVMFAQPWDESKKTRPGSKGRIPTPVQLSSEFDSVENSRESLGLKEAADLGTTLLPTSADGPPPVVHHGTEPQQESTVAKRSPAPVPHKKRSAQQVGDPSAFTIFSATRASSTQESADPARFAPSNKTHPPPPASVGSTTSSFQKARQSFHPQIQAEHDLASSMNSTSADALAETFGNVMGFVPVPPNPWIMNHHAHSMGGHHQQGMHPQHLGGPYVTNHHANYSTVPMGYHPGHHYIQPNQVPLGYSPMHVPHQLFSQPQPTFLPQVDQSYSAHAFSMAALASIPDAARLHVVFGKPLPEEVVHEAFDAAAPGLQYVSKHREKTFAFVKYSSSASAMLAMVRMHGSLLMGQKLRVTLADPPPADSSSRKRQRDVVTGEPRSRTNLDEGDDDAAGYSDLAASPDLVSGDDHNGDTNDGEDLNQ